MNVIAEKKISNLQFDKTILCTITDIVDENEGIYEVSFSSSQSKTTHFTAYAQEGVTYAIDDNVYVNVPQNDFSNQKTIIRKYISDQSSPINYIVPLERMIKIKTIEQAKDFELKANGSVKEKLIFEQIWPDTVNQFDCLGVAADFKTLLGNYNLVEGEYGLRFEFVGLKDGWDIDQGNLNNYMVYKTETFSNKDMYGMPYDYFYFQQQQKLINLQDFPYPIHAMRVYFYQDENFKDINGTKVPGDSYNVTSSKLDDKTGEWTSISIEKDTDPNLFVQNLQMHFGYLMGDAYDKELRLYTTSKTQYAEDWSEAANRKTLKLRWLEENDQGSFTAIDELSDKNDEDDPHFWDNKSIYLYKYTYNKDTDDPYAGPFWDEIKKWNPIKATEQEGYEPKSYKLVGENYEKDLESLGFSDPPPTFINNFSADDNPFEIGISIEDEDKQNAFVRYKMIIVETSYVPTSGLDENGNEITYYIVQEDIYESNTITFENRDQVASIATMSLIRGLTLECSDGTNGIYRIYGEDNKIAAQSNAREMKLTANFEAINIEKLDAGKITIKWSYPAVNTMFLKPVGEEWILNEDTNRYEYSTEIENLSDLKEGDFIDSMVSSINYTIDSFYSSLRTNNTIECTITRYGREYKAEKEFFFGHQGNNGTNYAFDIALERAYGSGELPAGEPRSDRIVPFLVVKDNPEWVKVKPTLIYGQEEITDSELLSKIRWSFYAESKSDGTNSDVELSATSGSEIFIRLNTTDIDNYSVILKASLQKGISGANDLTRDVELTTYLPIGVAALDSIVTYEGSTSIIYNDYGADPVYYEGEHRLLDIEKNKLSSITWDIIPADTYYPNMIQSQTKDDDGNQINLDEWMLRPTSMFFSGLEKEVSIRALQGGNVIFVQPLLITQNAWGNQTINQWDGSLKIDEENNYILSAMLGAGVKNNDNTFSGVLLGKVGTDYTAKTGIYGYGKGVQTYGFKEDGTAFIGASGMGRIEFDTSRDEGIISGGRYSTTNTEGIKSYTDEYTMEINLSQGKIIGRKHRVSDLEDKLEYVFDAQASKYPLKIGKEGSEKFKVSWDGTVEMSGAIIGNPWDLGSDSSTVPVTDNSTIEDLLKGIYKDYTDKDSEAAANANNALSLEIADRMAADADNLAALNATASELSDAISQEEQERRQEIINRFNPNNLYNSMIKTVDLNGDGTKYFLVTNKTYGSGTSQTQFLIEDATSGTLVVKNILAEGIVNAYAGQFGGWNLLPGLMHYGYGTNSISTREGFQWYGDFSANQYERLDSSGKKWENVSLEDLATGDLVEGTFRLKTDTSVEVGSQKAFIYLGNSGNGINISKFKGKSDDEGKLSNIIFSLGKNFAVNKDGDLFASDGAFSGTITSNEGQIGGWYITSKGIQNSKEDPTVYLKSIKNNSPSSTIPVLKIGENFVVYEDGSAVATSIDLAQYLAFDEEYTENDGPNEYNTCIGEYYQNRSGPYFAAFFYARNYGNRALSKIKEYNNLLITEKSAQTIEVSTPFPEIYDKNNNKISSTYFYAINTGKYYKSIEKVSYNYKNIKGEQTSYSHYEFTEYERSSHPSIEVVKNTSGKKGLLKASEIEVSGNISATSGTIGPWRITDKGFLFDTSTLLGDNNLKQSMFITPTGLGEQSKTIHSRSSSDWALGINNKFGVTIDGTLYATGANIAGEITASSGTIGNWKIDEGKLISTTSEANIILDPSAANDSSIVFQAGDNFKVTKTGALTATSAILSSAMITNASFTGILSASHIQGELNQNTSKTTWNRGLSFNTDKSELGFWKNALYGGMASNSAYNKTNTNSNLHHKSYLGFLRGGGEDSNSPTNVFLGIKWSDSTLKLIDKESSTYWNLPTQSPAGVAPYGGFIRYSGQARFFSLTIGGIDTGYQASGTYSDAGASQLIDDYTNTLYGIDHEGKGHFQSLAINGNNLIGTADTYWGSTETEKRCILTSGLMLTTGTGDDKRIKWKDTSGYCSYGLATSGNAALNHVCCNNLWVNGTQVTPSNYLTKVPDQSGTADSGDWYNCKVTADGTIQYYNTWPWCFSTSAAYKTWNSNTNRYGSLMDGQLWFNTSSSVSGASGNSFNLGINGSTGSAAFYHLMCDDLWIGGIKCAPLSSGSSDFSDIRLKQNLQIITNLDLYDNLIPYSFEWKENNKKSYGFIAQDIEKLSQKYENNSDTLYYKTENDHPEYIDEDKEYRIDYQQFHALHVAKNHQQDARIQSLESEVTSLRAQLEQLLREKGGN